VSFWWQEARESSAPAFTLEHLFLLCVGVCCSVWGNVHCAEQCEHAARVLIAMHGWAIGCLMRGCWTMREVLCQHLLRGTRDHAFTVNSVTLWLNKIGQWLLYIPKAKWQGTAPSCTPELSSFPEQRGSDRSGCRGWCPGSLSARVVPVPLLFMMLGWAGKKHASKSTGS